MPTDVDNLDDEVERVGLWRRYRRRRFRRRSIFWRWRRLLFLALLAAVTALAGIGLVLSRIEFPAQADRLHQTSFICTREVTRNCNQDNAAATLVGDENRVIVPYDRIPRVLVNAVVSAEDQNFWEHG